MEEAWRGTMRELIEAAARNPENELNVRLAAAAQLLKHELNAPPPRVKLDLSVLDAGEKATLLTLLEKVLGKNPQLKPATGRVIEGRSGSDGGF